MNFIALKENILSLKEEAINLTKTQKSEMDRFYKSHVQHTTDPIMVIIKTHLYLETCLDHCFEQNLPIPNKILKKSFATKVDIFEALRLGHPGNEQMVVDKLRLINNVRNSFAHNLNYKMSKQDWNNLTKNLSVNEKLSDLQKLKSVLSNFIGYFNGLMTFTDFLPFISSILRNWSVFEKDKLWNKKAYVNVSSKEMYEILDGLKINNSGKCRGCV